MSDTFGTVPFCFLNRKALSNFGIILNPRVDANSTLVELKLGEFLLIHILLFIFVLLLIIRKKNWRNWEKFHSTILYVVICNLLYNFLCTNALLWEYKPGLIFSRINVEIIYGFIILPGGTLLYLTYYPFQESFKKKFLYIGKWVLISLLLEYIFIKTGYLELKRGYKYWMELLFYPTMYVMLRLHHSRPILTYGLSTIIILYLLWQFDVPAHLPIDKR